MNELEAAYDERTRRMLRAKHAFLRREKWAPIANVLRYVLLGDLAVGFLPWVVLLIVCTINAPDQVLFLLVAAFHGTATLSGLWSLQYFMDRTEAISILDTFAWLVPSVLALVTDTFGLALHLKHALAEDPLVPLDVALSFFYGLLTLGSLVYVIMFGMITVYAFNAKMKARRKARRQEGVKISWF